MKLSERVELIRKSLAQCEEEATSIIVATMDEDADPDALSKRINVVAARLFRLKAEAARMFEEYHVDNPDEEGYDPAHEDDQT